MNLEICQQCHIKGEIIFGTQRMIDAMGKIGPGFMDGNSYAGGAYDKCLDIGHAEYCVGKVTLVSLELRLLFL